MLVFADGSQFGTLGGGCVEAEVKRRALGLIDSGEPGLFTFNLDDDYGWDDGLICGGRMSVLADPIGSAHLDYFEAFHELVSHGDGCIEAIILDATRVPGARPGSRVLFGPSGQVIRWQRLDEVTDQLRDRLPELSRRVRPISSGAVAYLPVLPRSRLVIVGAGHVGQAVAQLAAQADFDIWVIDDRDRYANRDRFPTAERILVGDIGQILPSLDFDERTFCIIVTRGHSHDEEALYHLAGRPTQYLGMIGSKRKIRLIYDDLRAAGIPAEPLDRVHAPIGIDIGSQTVPEIAISIVAELIAVRNLARPRSLQTRTSQHLSDPPPPCDLSGMEATGSERSR